MLVHALIVFRLKIVSTSGLKIETKRLGRLIFERLRKSNVLSAAPMVERVQEPESGKLQRNAGTLFWLCPQNQPLLVFSRGADRHRGANGIKTFEFIWRFFTFCDGVVSGPVSRRLSISRSRRLVEPQGRLLYFVIEPAEADLF